MAQEMTGTEVMALLGAAGVLIGIVGAAIVRDRSLHRTIKEGDDRLHERVNRIRDEYVKRADHETALGRIEAAVKEMREEQRQLYKEVIQALSQRRSQT